MAVTGPVQSTSMKQVCSTTITNLISQYFASTLGTEKNIVQIVMAIIQQESSFIAGRTGPQIATTLHTVGGDYYNSTPILNLRLNGTPQQKSNVGQGIVAWGLMQSLGLNHVKGASSSGKCLLETAHGGQFVSTLCINPGEDISALLGPASSVQNQILAGLAILESKYIATTQRNGAYYITGTQINYPTKIQCAIRGYIGGGSTDTGNGSSSTTYVDNVYYGSMYKLANGPGGPSAPNATAVGAAGGPPITIASGNNQHPVGC